VILPNEFKNISNQGDFVVLRKSQYINSWYLANICLKSNKMDLLA